MQRRAWAVTNPMRFSGVLIAVFAARYLWEPPTKPGGHNESAKAEARRT